ncbi:hypothetical protein HDU87_005781 [Geranomyces variabilis]|uniref:SH3 domain-containing protein n=1 Tax=Geranomyces variabilis TaxID=109894 RepID=A0AAD5TIT1_9FUNG|nr:hypothetical protein HDU87_005781 [Geranomyces variabilis]
MHASNDFEDDHDDDENNGINSNDSLDTYDDDDGDDDDDITEPIDFGLVYALHTFVANLEGQVCVLKGDSLDLLDDSNSYWWLVKCLKTDEIGYIPAENVETPYERLARLNKSRNVGIAAVQEIDLQPAPVDPNAPPKRNIFFPENFAEYILHSDDEDSDDSMEYPPPNPQAEKKLNTASLSRNFLSKLLARSSSKKGPKDPALPNHNSLNRSSPLPSSEELTKEPINVLRIYAGNVDLKATFKTVALTPSLTALELLEVALKRFRVPNATPNEYYVSVLHMDAQERRLGGNDKIYDVLENLRHKGLPGVGDSAAGVSKVVNSSGAVSSVRVTDENIIRVLINKKLNLFEKNYHLIRIFMYDDSGGGGVGKDQQPMRTYKTIGVDSNTTVGEIKETAYKKFKIRGAGNGWIYSLNSIFKGQEQPRDDSERIYPILMTAEHSSDEIDFVLRREWIGHGPAPSLSTTGRDASNLRESGRSSLMDDLQEILTFKPAFLDELPASTSAASSTGGPFAYSPDSVGGSREHSRETSQEQIYGSSSSSLAHRQGGGSSTIGQMLDDAPVPPNEAPDRNASNMQHLTRSSSLTARQRFESMPEQQQRQQRNASVSNGSGETNGGYNNHHAHATVATTLQPTPPPRATPPQGGGHHQSQNHRPNNDSRPNVPPKTVPDDARKNHQYYTTSQQQPDSQQQTPPLDSSQQRSQQQQSVVPPPRSPASENWRLPSSTAKRYDIPQPTSAPVYQTPREEARPVPPRTASSHAAMGGASSRHTNTEVSTGGISSSASWSNGDPYPKIAPPRTDVRSSRVNFETMEQYLEEILKGEADVDKLRTLEARMRDAMTLPASTMGRSGGAAPINTSRASASASSASTTTTMTSPYDDSGLNEILRPWGAYGGASGESLASVAATGGGTMGSSSSTSASAARGRAAARKQNTASVALSSVYGALEADLEESIRGVVHRRPSAATTTTAATSPGASVYHTPASASPVRERAGTAGNGGNDGYLPTVVTKPRNGGAVSDDDDEGGERWASAMSSPDRPQPPPKPPQMYASLSAVTAGEEAEQQQQPMSPGRRERDRKIVEDVFSSMQRDLDALALTPKSMVAPSQRS